MIKRICLFLLLPALSLAQKSEEITLPVTGGELKGTLLLPINEKPPVIVIVAGSGPTDRNGDNPMGVKAASYRLLAEELASKGIATLRYDKRGIAASQSAGLKEDELRFEDYIRDAAAWISSLSQSGRFSKVLVAGHSEGSLISMVAAQQSPVAGFISIAGPGQNIADILKTQLAALPAELKTSAFEGIDLLKKGESIPSPNPALMSLFRPSVQPYMISWMKYTPSEEIKKLKIPALIIQGSTDIQVAESEATLLHQAAPGSTLKVITGMNHVLKDAPADQMANMATYANSNLPLSKGLTDSIAEFTDRLK